MGREHSGLQAANDLIRHVAAGDLAQGFPTGDAVDFDHVAAGRADRVASAGWHCWLASSADWTAIGRYLSAFVLLQVSSHRFVYSQRTAGQSQQWHPVESGFQPPVVAHLRHVESLARST